MLRHRIAGAGAPRSYFGLISEATGSTRVIRTSGRLATIPAGVATLVPDEGGIVQRVRPNFFIIGAAKAGTTTLWHLLRQHPDIFMPELKEPWFLSHDDRYEKLGWSWYERLFRPGANCAAVGEASSCYCVTRLYPNAVRRLGRYFPDARLIYCVREPYARIESAWKQCLVTQHPMPPDFADAVRTYKLLIDSTRYGESLQAFLGVFPRSQIHIVLFDELSRTPVTVYGGCLEFLGVDPSFVPSDLTESKNRSADKRIDTPAYLALKRSWPARIGRRILPPTMRKFFVRKLKQPVAEAVWTPELREWVRNALEDDTRQFLQLAGLDRDLWTSAV